MRCSCNGNMKDGYQNIMGVRTKVSVCSRCGKELIDMNEAIRAQKKLLPQIRKEQKIIRLSKSSMYSKILSGGRLTIPKQIGDKLHMKAWQQFEIEADERSIVITLKN